MGVHGGRTGLMENSGTKYDRLRGGEHLCRHESPLRALARSRTRRTLAVVGASLLAGASDPARAQVANHLKCDPVKDALHVTAAVDLTPRSALRPAAGVGTAEPCGVPAEVHVPAAAAKKLQQPILARSVRGTDAGARVPNKVHCPATPVPVADQTGTDQFGRRALRKLNAFVVCALVLPGPVMMGARDAR